MTLLRIIILIIFSALYISISLSTYANSALNYNQERKDPETVKKDSIYQFLQDRALEDKKGKISRANRYEEIIGGSISILIGSIGYYTTHTDILRLAYSGAQSIGIITVGNAIYNYYAPSLDENFIRLSSVLDNLKNSPFSWRDSSTWKDSSSVKEISEKKPATDHKLETDQISSQNIKNIKEELAIQFLAYHAQRDRAKRLSLMATSSLLAVQFLTNAFLVNIRNDLKNIYTFLGCVNLLVVGHTLLFKSDYEREYLKLGPHFNWDRVNQDENIQSSSWNTTNSEALSYLKSTPSISNHDLANDEKKWEIFPFYSLTSKTLINSERKEKLIGVAGRWIF